MSKVNVFVSSTCYDLSQVRNDIKQCIIELGHNPILSELNDFPVNPNLNSSENCINAVKNEADIFVLIIGDKYGSVLDSGKSITNTEFLTAIEKGIPIYTFTKKEMLSILPVWEKNPGMNLSGVVDNEKIFEFLSDIRKKRGIWNFGFEKAQDITDILKSQLSILFKESLKTRNSFLSLGENEIFSKASSKALDIIMKKEPYYEIRFFMQVFLDEINKLHNLRNDYDYSVIIKSSNHIKDFHQLMDWWNFKLGQVQNYMDSMNRLIEPFGVFYGQPGVPSDLNGLYYVACSYAKLYASFLEWGIEIKSCIVPEDYKKAMMAFSKLPSRLICQIEEYPKKSLETISQMAEREKNGEDFRGTTLSLTLTLSIDDDINKELDNELNILKNMYL